MNEQQHMFEPAPGMPWDDVADAASKMFNVWVTGSELEWAKECWGHFEQQGLTADSSVLEKTRACLRLVALARIYHEFCGCAWDENPETSIDVLAENLEINGVALGVLAASAKDVGLEDCQDEYDLLELALVAATDAMRNQIYECLSKAYGGPVELYSRMSQTNHTKDIAGDEDEFDVTGYNMRALDYVQNGFQPV